MREVVISAGKVSVRARLLDTPTAERIWAALPIHASAQTWGAELYFQTAITTDREPGAKECVRAGEIANPGPAEIGLRMIQLWNAIQASAAQGGQLVRI